MDLLLIVDSQRRSIRLSREAVKERELRKEKELQDALSLLAQQQNKDSNSNSQTEEKPENKNTGSAIRRIGDDVRSFFSRPSPSPSPLTQSKDNCSDHSTTTTEPAPTTQVSFKLLLESKST